MFVAPWQEYREERLLMSEIANASIKAFGPMPKADVSQDEPVFEIPLSELQGILKALVDTYNQITEVVRSAGVLRGRALARVTESHNKALMAERSPLIKMHLLNAYVRQHLTRIRDALKARPTAEGGKVVQVCSKIMSRAIQLIDHVKSFGQGKDVSLDSSQARLLFAGKEGEEVSRKEAIRAMMRAKRLWPALLCSHRPGDGRRTMRLVAKKEDIAFAPEIDYSYAWQRCGKSIGLSL